MGVLSNMNLKNTEKEVYCVFKASVLNGEDVRTELLGVFDTLEEAKKNAPKLDVTGHKTVVKAKLTIDPVEFLGDIDSLK
ncbi:hypothetical protein SAMN04487886_103124 [Clostridium sp. DSM 8431]|uniref:hypothetical protein n=1 Tax=Clostridium sp. DSM 8431 TaxID=1761781 RepID=UPI0008F1B92E|nr:hypothetical protein [Clostridium sp. DSM 8431]SFU45358.1 hypothetical protein SAMN04487886_103124 [Clostridium sp. DSM 8431]